MESLTGESTPTRPRDSSLSVETQRRLWRWRAELGRRLELARDGSTLRELEQLHPDVPWATIRRIERGSTWRIPLLAICQACQAYGQHPGPLLRDLDGAFQPGDLLAWPWSQDPEIPTRLVDRIRTQLRALREQSGLSTTRLGHAVGLPQTSVVRLESGETRLDVLQAEVLAQALHSSLSLLLPEL